MWTCERADFEPGFEKIALFADADGTPTHAARQLDDSTWTSKLGVLEDIQHVLAGLTGTTYGSVVRIMKRALPSAATESR